MADDYDKQYSELIKSLELIETSLKRSILELEGLGIGPNDSLFDSEGYPRGDIDLYRVRSLRSSIASNYDCSYYIILLKFSIRTTK